MYVLSYPQNMFSVKQATQQEVKSYIILRGEKGNLYYLNMCMKGSVRKSTLKEWHRILGHVKKNDVSKLEKVVEDMKITEKKDFDCDSCTLGKQTVTRNRTADTRSKSPLEFAHSDLSGSVELPAREGFRYDINFVDDHTGSTFIYFLKFKSDARKALKKFLAYSGQFGTVKKLQSDNGSECLLTNTYRRNTNGEKD